MLRRCSSVDDTRKTLSDAHQTGITFLIVDLEVAFTFLDTADASQQQETVERCHRSARTAYDTVLGFAKRLHLNESEREAVESKLNALRGRLERTGQEF